MRGGINSYIKGKRQVKVWHCRGGAIYREGADEIIGTLVGGGADRVV